MIPSRSGQVGGGVSRRAGIWLGGSWQTANPQGGCLSSPSRGASDVARLALAAGAKASRWPTADKKRSGPPRATLSLAISGGHGRTGTVIRGQNLLLWPLVRQRSRSEFGGVPWTKTDKMETRRLGVAERTRCSARLFGVRE